MTDLRSRPQSAAAGLRRVAPCLVTTAVFVFMAVLYLLGFTGAYHTIFHLWGVDSWPFPFLDTDTVLSAIRCLDDGYDVFDVNPCDPLGRVYDYSPLWLLLALYPATGTWLQPIGLGIDIAFLLSLLLLPAARSWRGTLLIILGTLSTASVFALERGNNDLVLFVLAALAAASMQHSLALRTVGYACALLAGLLKYYPMTLMALATRETPKVFVTVAILSSMVLAVFLFIAGEDLVRALHLIPTGPYFSYMVGSISLSGALGDAFGWPARITSILHAACIAGAFLLGLRWYGRSGVGRDIERLTAAERTFLMTGALLVISFFFTAQNIGYRATHLVLALPALTALWRVTPGRRLYGVIVIVALGLLWSQGWRDAANSLAAPYGPLAAGIVLLPLWLLREAMWWWLIVILIGLLTALLLRSPMALTALRMLAPIRRHRRRRR